MIDWFLNKPDAMIPMGISEDIYRRSFIYALCNRNLSDEILISLIKIAEV